MITEIQRRFLEKLANETIRKEDNPKRYSSMMIAIQKRIDGNIMMALWLIDHDINILRDETAEIDNENLERYRRFKAFAYICNKLDPQSQFEQFDLKDALKMLSLLYPKYYFEIIKKEFRDRDEKNQRAT